MASGQWPVATLGRMMSPLLSRGTFHTAPAATQTEHCRQYLLHCELHCTLYLLHCTLHTAHSTCCTVHYTAHCTLYLLHCELHYTLHTVYAALHNSPFCRRTFVSSEQLELNVLFGLTSLYDRPARGEVRQLTPANNCE